MKNIARLILGNRILLSSLVMVFTLIMGVVALKISMSYEFARVLPDADSTSLAYDEFKKKFGEDGSVMVVGFKDPDFFRPEKFNRWNEVVTGIKKINGIREVLSVTNLYNIYKNDSLEKMEFKQVARFPVTSQPQMDSIKEQLFRLPFYEGLLFNKDSSFFILAITFEKKQLDSQQRLEIVKFITDKTEKFSSDFNVKMHYSGMPYIRSEMMRKVREEMKLFMSLAVLVTAVILWLFFRNLLAVFFSLLITAFGVIATLGIMQLFGYKITILSGLIPPIIIVIGVPNCIFLINKYQAEYALNNHRMLALSRTIETVGVSLFLANVTTAIGFGVLYFTNTQLLVEFGIVAAIGVMVTYLITVVLVPITYSYLAPPSLKSIRHQENKNVNRFLMWVDHIVHRRRPIIYISMALLTSLSVVGLMRINVLGYVVDDIPQKDPVYTDLKFFERNVKGVLPFEILVDTKRDSGVIADNARAIYKISALQREMADIPVFSKPLSLAEGLKFSYQAFKNGNPKFYRMPPADDLFKMTSYSSVMKGQGDKMQFFIDKGKRFTRISFQIADVGSDSIEKLVQAIRPKADSIFPPKDYDVSFTGHSLVFLKGNSYLLGNLFESLIIEIVLVTLVGLALFRSLRVIILSKLPVLIPLVVTAGIMGFLGIRFKPSTILIFSIAFGISSDGTIYFLTKYRQELKRKGVKVKEAISIAIRETGLSMIYTAIILFCGFAIFSASSFGGTAALGTLLSITLLTSMGTNLILLPAILLSIDKRKSRKELVQKPLLDLDSPESDS